MTARLRAERLADLGLFYSRTNHPQLAYTTCQEALKADVSLPSARTCVDEAIASLQKARKARFFSSLTAIDARLVRGENGKSLNELSRLHNDLAPPDSPLGDFDDAMYKELNSRFKLNTWMQRLLWLPKGLLWVARGLLWIVIVSIALWATAFVWKRLKAWNQRLGDYKKTRLESQNVIWKVWSILDTRGEGGAGPVMDSLNVYNNPLLKEFRPSSLLLAPPRTLLGETGTNQLEQVEIWRDFIDDPRKSVGMEYFPPDLFKRHEFSQEEAFDELDIKIGGFEAKGFMSLIRMVRRWAERGLPAAQGLVFTLKEPGTSKSFACVRITCNWTTALKAMRSDGKTKPLLGLDEEDHGDTLSVFASSEEEPSIDAVALSAQRAAFKLFHRLALKSPPNYASAVANFHQGVALLDQYL